MFIKTFVMQRPNPSKRIGFTLVEILVVLGIFSVLAAIALPMVRRMVSEQKGANTSRAITSYIDATRRRAIASGQPMGILVERLSTSNTVDFATSAAIRLRQMRGVPSYSGESSEARAVLWHDPNYPSSTNPTPGLNTAEFELNDNQLVNLSYQIGAQNDAPIQAGDLLELPGGRVVSVLQIDRGQTLEAGNTTIVVKLRFDLRESVTYAGATSQRFPNGRRLFGSGTQVPYKIHRRPTVSTSAPYDLPRGMAIDLSYSGIGPVGTQFAPFVQSGTPAANAHTTIMFGADGRVIGVREPNGTLVSPTGLIFLCLGNTDGVRPDDLFSTETGAVANVMNLETIWIVINPNTGRVVSAPSATAATGGGITEAVRSSRLLALLGDTLDNK